MNHTIPHTGRPKFDFRTTHQDNFKQLKKDHPEFKKLKVSPWRQIIINYTEMYKEHALETGEMMDIPGDCGKLAIKKKKRRTHVVDPKTGKSHINLPVDWKKSHEKGKRMFIMNYHTDGYHFGWLWFKKTKKMMIKFPNIWKFKAMKATGKLLQHYLTVDQKYQNIYREWADNMK
jgi:hypothetical protein